MFSDTLSYSKNSSSPKTSASVLLRRVPSGFFWIVESAHKPVLPLRSASSSNDITICTRVELRFPAVLRNVVPVATPTTS